MYNLLGLTQLCCLLPLLLSAQQPTPLDNLLAACDAYPQEDTIKAKMLVQLAYDIRRTNPVKGQEAAEEAMAIAQRFGHQFLYAEALKMKGFNVYNQGQYAAGIAEVEKAWKIHTSEGNAAFTAQTAMKIGILYYSIYEYARAKDWLQKALQGLEALQDKTNTAECLNALGKAEVNLSENLEALAHFNRSLSLNKSIKNTQGIQYSYANLGLLYSNIGNYKQAIDYYQKSLTLSETIGDTQNAAHVYNNLGGLYYRLNDVQKALEYQSKAITLFEKLGLMVYLGAGYVNLAAEYRDLKEYEKALEYNQKGLDILTSLNALDQMAICLSNIGATYISLHDYGNAIKYHEQALAIFQKLGNKAEVARVLLNFGSIYRDAPDSILQNNGIDPKLRYEKSEAFLKDGIQQAKEIGAQAYVQYGMKELSLNYEAGKFYVQAYETFKNYVALRDSVTGEDVRQEVTRKEIQYEFDKKEVSLKFEQQLTLSQLEKQKLLSVQQQQELELSNKEKDLQRLAYLHEKVEKQEKEQQLSLSEKDKQLQDVQLGALLQEKALQLKTLAEKNAMIGFLFAGLAAILLGFAAFYWWLRQKQAKKEIKVQAQFTRQLLENIEADRGRIAIDLHDSVSHDLLLLKQSIRKDITGTDVGDKIDGIINGIRHISRNLHPVMLDKIGLRLSLETLCEQFMLHQTMFVSYEIDYQNTLSKTAELQLFRIVQEGLTNALKYAKAEAVKVQINYSGNSLRLEIQDNGKGFDVEKALESGKAFGLHSMLQRAKAIGGTAEIRSKEGGTKVIVVVG